MNYYKFFFFYFLLFLSIVSWMLNSWLFIWFMMELSLVSFMGVLYMSKGYSLTEFAMKYFIIQAVFSLIFLVFFVVYSFNLFLFMNLGFVLFFALKLGLFPFHFWLIMIVGKLGWLTFMVLSSLMKIIPIVMYFYSISFHEFSYVIWGSLIVGSLGGLNNCSVQKLMSYSSMVHLSWMLYSLELNVLIFWLYFLCYLFLIFWLVYLMSFLNVYFVSQFKFNSSSYLLLFVMFLYGLSLAGFPPFLGFLMKWTVLSVLWVNYSSLVGLGLVVLSVLSCYFYLQLYFYIMLMYGISCKWTKTTFAGLGILGFLSLLSCLLLFYIW